MKYDLSGRYDELIKHPEAFPFTLRQMLILAMAFSPHRWRFTEDRQFQVNLTQGWMTLADGNILSSYYDALNLAAVFDEAREQDYAIWLDSTDDAFIFTAGCFYPGVVYKKDSALLCTDAYHYSPGMAALLAYLRCRGAQYFNIEPTAPNDMLTEEQTKELDGMMRQFIPAEELVMPSKPLGESQGRRGSRERAGKLS